MNYKIEQLTKMLVVETNPETAGYGAHLTHWYSTEIKAINIDAKAIRALIDHYKTRLDPVTQLIKDEGFNPKV